MTTNPPPGEISKKILIAEDDKTSRRILKEMTRKWGYEPIVSRNGEEAWEILQKPEAPKLVLLDWLMPGISGLEVCRRAQQRNDHDPPYIIFLTSRDEKEDLVKCLEAGGSDFIAKPYHHTELRARIEVGRRIVELQSELNKAKEALTRKALYDPLTGIYNRGAILEALDRELKRAEREKNSLTVGLFDIDYFKGINDSKGHLAGDKILYDMIQRLQRDLRKYDQLGRLGGEEFLVISPVPTPGGNRKFYERLRCLVSETRFSWQGSLIPVTISIGVVDSLGSESVSEILARADAAMYQAKAAGRNQIIFS